jgi:hypothetical protein
MVRWTFVAGVVVKPGRAIHFPRNLKAIAELSVSHLVIHPRTLFSPCQLFVGRDECVRSFEQAIGNLSQLVCLLQ